MQREPVSTAKVVTSFAVGELLERAMLDRLIIRMIGAAFDRGCVGQLQLTLPSGASVMFGTGQREATPRVVLKTYRVLWSMLSRGPLGFAESYMAGDVDCDNLLDLFGFLMDNEHLLTQSSVLSAPGWVDRIYHRLRANTRTGSRRNIAAHYDLGNVFYQLWLDAGMTYSSGIFTTPDTTLEMAQTEKYEQILDGLDLQSDQSLLEIGCGWGGFAEAASARAASVTGITISEEQFAAASARMAAAGVADRVDIRFQDYRETSGQFDRIASIEMIEAVGEANWPTYFRTIADRLKPGGKAVVQAITIRRDYFEAYRRNPDFIQRYVFPGGMLPTEDIMGAQARASGLGFETLQVFGASYAMTLADWRRRFLAAWPQVAALGFDERFKRLWLYYLAYCQVGFERGSVQVGLYRFTKPQAGVA